MMLVGKHWNSMLWPPYFVDSFGSRIHLFSASLLQRQREFICKVGVVTCLVHIHRYALIQEMYGVDSSTPDVVNITSTKYVPRVTRHSSSYLQ